jgi:hypothetical protein
VFSIEPIPYTMGMQHVTRFAKPHYLLMILIFLFALCGFLVDTTFRNGAAYIAPCFNFHNTGKRSEVTKSDVSRAMAGWDLPVWTTLPGPTPADPRVLDTQVRLNAAVAHGGVTWWPEQLTHKFATFASQGEAKRKQFDLGTVVKEDTIVEQWSNPSTHLATCYPDGGTITNAMIQNNPSTTNATLAAIELATFEASRKGQNLYFDEVCGYKAFSDFDPEELGYELIDQDGEPISYVGNLGPGVTEIKFANQPKWTFPKTEAEGDMEAAFIRAKEVQEFVAHSCKHDLHVVFGDLSPDSKSSKAPSTKWPIGRSFGVLMLVTATVLFLHMIAMTLSTMDKLRSPAAKNVWMVLMVIALAAITGLMIWVEVEVRDHYNLLQGVGATGKRDGAGYAANMQPFTAAKLLAENDNSKRFKLFQDLEPRNDWSDAGPTRSTAELNPLQTYSHGQMEGTCLQAIFFPHGAIEDSWVGKINVNIHQCDNSYEDVDITPETSVDQDEGWFTCSPATGLKIVGNGIEVIDDPISLKALNLNIISNADEPATQFGVATNAWNANHGSFKYCLGSTKTTDGAFSAQAPKNGVLKHAGADGFSFKTNEIGLRTVGSLAEQDACSDGFCVDYGWKYWTTDRPQLYEGFIGAGLSCILLYLVFVLWVAFGHHPPADSGNDDGSSWMTLF